MGEKVCITHASPTTQYARTRIPRLVSSHAQASRANAAEEESPALSRSGCETFPSTMVLSKRYAKAKSDKYSGNIHKRNNVPQSVSGKKSYPFTVGPVLLAFFLFVVLGSSLLELLFKVAG